MKQKPLFIAVEGPNCGGKTTIAKAITELLLKKKYMAIYTKEPTEDEFGNYVRLAEKMYRGWEFFNLILANRYYHVDTCIKQELKDSNIIVSDRYIASSLVLQSADGINIKEIWKNNEMFPKPDLLIHVTAETRELEKRMAERGIRSRFEDEISRAEEKEKFVEAINFLSQKGWSVITFDTTNTKTLKEIEMYAESAIIAALERMKK